MAIDLQVLAPEAILLAFVLVTLFIYALGSKRSATLMGWLALLGVVLAGAASLYYWGDTAPTFQGMVAADGYGLFSNLVFLLAAGLAIVMGLVTPSTERQGTASGAEFSGENSTSTSSRLSRTGSANCS